MKINIIDADTQKALNQRIDALKEKEKDIRDSLTISNEQVWKLCKGITEQELFDYLHLESVYVYFNHISSLCKILTRTNKSLIPHISVTENTEFKDFVTKVFADIEKYEDNFLNLDAGNVLWWSKAREKFYIIPLEYQK
jgi:chloramphenicol O-acetyltransferase